jgi:hypothetical protein
VLYGVVDGTLFVGVADYFHLRREAGLLVVFVFLLTTGHGEHRAECFPFCSFVLKIRSAPHGLRQPQATCIYVRNALLPLEPEARLN